MALIDQPFDDPIHIQSVVDRVAERIEAAIIRGELAVGTKLSELRLSKALGVSRAPVREALRRLEGKKLIERRPHIGARVFSPSREDVVAVLIVREALEGMAARLVAENATTNELDELAAIVDRQGAEGRAGSERALLPETAFDFHYRLAQATHNPKLIQLLCDDLYAIMRVHRYRSSLTTGRVHDAHQEHSEIMAALRKRDADRAESLMRKHIAQARKNVECEQDNPTGVAKAKVRPAA